MDWSSIIAFTIVAGLLVVSPGPNSLLIAKTVPTSGKGAGFANILGFMTAFYLHGALAVLGISVILARSAELFMAVKMLGAAYLCWIGIKALRDAWRGGVGPLNAPGNAKPRRLSGAYLEGFLTNALNPKTTMFYLAALPQFLPFGEVSATSTLLLVFIHSLLNFAWFGFLVIAFSRLVGLARNSRVGRWIKAATGVVFLGFGAQLATFRP